MFYYGLAFILNKIYLIGCFCTSDGWMKLKIETKTQKLTKKMVFIQNIVYLGDGKNVVYLFQRLQIVK